MLLCRNGVLQSFIEVLWDLLVGDHVDEEMVAKVVCIAWAMWNNRNGREVVYWAINYSEEYQAAMDCMITKETLAEDRAV